MIHWAESFFAKHSETDSLEYNPKLEKALNISEDMYLQWELYLVNKYGLQELQKLDFSKVKLPDEWFQNWQFKLFS